MEGYVPALCTVVSLVVICTVQCTDDTVSVIKRLEALNREVASMKKDLAGVDESIIHQIDLAKISLRSELKQHISDHVREALAGILQGESIEEMVRSQVITEVRQLKRGNHVLKRQLHNVLMSVRDVREEMNVYKDALEKGKREASELKVCSKYTVGSEILKRDLEKWKRSTKKCRERIVQKDKNILEMNQNLKAINQTYQLKLIEFNISTATTQRVASPSELTTTMVTSFGTTPKPEEERSRIIIAPMWSSTQQQFRQLNIHRNNVTTYPLRSLKQVTSVAYVSKLRKLLIGLYIPHRIVSSNLDSYDVVTVRENIRTYGMAVDEERKIVFLTTEIPRYSISRMTTHGKDITAIIDLSSYGGIPLAIAVNSKDKKIYACNEDKVFMVTYDGRVLQTLALATANNMHALTLDITGSVLYYNDNKKLMKMSLYQNVTEEVTTLDVFPWNIAYYKDTIYYSSHQAHKVGAVDVGDNIVSYTLQTVQMKNAFNYALCLVP